MVNNCNRFIRGTVHRARLHAVFGILHCLLVCAFGKANTLYTHLEAGCVHHHKHVLQALVFFANQIADCTLAHLALVVAKQQHCGWGGFDAQLVFDGRAIHIVALAQRTIVVDHEFGHQEQADALHTFGRVGRSGQHQVQNVLCHVVFTVGDVNFLARNAVSAIALRHGLGAHHGQV